MQEYYFRYVVTDHFAHECNTFRKAKSLSRKLGEKIYLTTFSKLNSYNEPYHEEEVNTIKEVPALKKKMIRQFYEITNTKPMSRKDYQIAYKFLKIRASESGFIEPFRTTIQLPPEQQVRIHRFLQHNHQVRFL